MRTMSPTTVTVGLSSGPPVRSDTGACAENRSANEPLPPSVCAPRRELGRGGKGVEGGESKYEERERGKPDHHGSTPQRIIADVDCSI